MYEPLWEDLHERAKQNGWRIRSIWIADMAGQGTSGALNEKLLGNDRMHLVTPLLSHVSQMSKTKTL